MLFVNESLKRVREFLKKPGWTVSRLAKEAGMGESTLRQAISRDFKIQVITLQKLEAVVDSHEKKTGNSL